MRFTLTVFAFGALVAASACTPLDDPCDAELAKITNSYEGPVAALHNGDAYFSLGPECGVRVSGDYSSHEAIAQAWAASSFNGNLRPIEVSLVGSVRQPRDGSKNMVFEIERVDEAQPMTSTEGMSEIMQDAFQRQAPI